MFEVTSGHKTINNEDVQHNGELLEAEENHMNDDVSESDCFELYYWEIEHTVAYVEEGQQDDTALDSDIEDGNSDGEASVDEEADSYQVKASADRLLKEAPKEHYNKTTFFTQVQVKWYKPFCTFYPTKPKATKEKKKKTIIEEDEYDSGRVVDRAIGLAQNYINTAECSITPALNAKMKEYKIADQWRPLEPLMRSQGWARRPMSGGLYGRNYMNDKFKKICFVQFNRGIVNKGDKQSPTQTLALMKEEHQGFYCYPGLHEIVWMFSSLVQQSKQNGHKIISFQKISEPLVPPEIKAELQLMLDENPDWTPVPLLNEWKERFSGNREYDEEKVKKQATCLRAKLMIDLKR
ncbi:unnamed protein product [Cylindrotheca closterium]|uniref:Uncharacterized protein n=1 Tax=Cylindrotheca closterium TaxID=2856 RepID=A0AAD2JHM9_9STRA|nr:unnamed protein product [Cylindrotheca closterium]